MSFFILEKHEKIRNSNYLVNGKFNVTGGLKEIFLKPRKYYDYSQGLPENHFINTFRYYIPELFEKDFIDIIRHSIPRKETFEENRLRKINKLKFEILVFRFNRYNGNDTFINDSLKQIEFREIMLYALIYGGYKFTIKDHVKLLEGYGYDYVYQSRKKYPLLNETTIFQEDQDVIKFYELQERKGNILLGESIECKEKQERVRIFDDYNIEESFFLFCKNVYSNKRIKRCKTPNASNFSNLINWYLIQISGEGLDIDSDREIPEWFYDFKELYTRFTKKKCNVLGHSICTYIRGKSLNYIKDVDNNYTITINN